MTSRNNDGPCKRYVHRVLYLLLLGSLPSTFTFSVRSGSVYTRGISSKAPLDQNFPAAEVRQHLEVATTTAKRGSVLHETRPGGPSGIHRSSGISSTARESAVLAEWEPVSELQRRIDEGIHYEHWPDMETDGPSNPRQHQAHAGHFPESGPQRVRGVFCGYRTTQEERDRLKSADPHDSVE